jgi:hypothetical protein
MVDAVTVTFFMPERSGDPEMAPQPLLTIGRLQYPGTATPESTDVKNVCNPWDLWWAFFKSGSRPELEQIFYGADLDNSRIAWARWITVPLVSISSIERVTKLMSAITEHSSSKNG